MIDPGTTPLRRTWPGFLLLGAMLCGLLLAVAASDRPAFARADVDDNGRVSLREAVAVGVPPAEARREDTGDGRGLSRSEWQAVDMRADGLRGA